MLTSNSVACPWTLSEALTSPPPAAILSPRPSPNMESSHEAVPGAITEVSLVSFLHELLSHDMECELKTVESNSAATVATSISPSAGYHQQALVHSTSPTSHSLILVVSPTLPTQCLAQNHALSPNLPPQCPEENRRVNGDSGVSTHSALNQSCSSRDQSYGAAGHLTECGLAPWPDLHIQPVCDRPGREALNDEVPQQPLMRSLHDKDLTQAEQQKPHKNLEMEVQAERRDKRQHFKMKVSPDENYPSSPSSAQGEFDDAKQRAGFDRNLQMDQISFQHPITLASPPALSGLPQCPSVSSSTPGPAPISALSRQPASDGNADLTYAACGSKCQGGEESRDLWRSRHSSSSSSATSLTHGGGECEVAAAMSQPCDVCGEAASGHYFGALVCLPCKSFFIRCTKGGEPAFTPECGGNCDVLKSGRIRCQYCRFQRCLSAGMNRKEKPEAVIPGEGQVLCKVCNDIANGIHFGVTTCEGCKKFFRRGLKEYKAYVCKANGTCTVNPRMRNSCRYCRYQKCLRVGMSREAIKMGRPKKSEQACLRPGGHKVGTHHRHHQQQQQKSRTEAPQAGSRDCMTSQRHDPPAGALRPTQQVTEDDRELQDPGDETEVEERSLDHKFSLEAVGEASYMSDEFLEAVSVHLASKQVDKNGDPRQERSPSVPEPSVNECISSGGQAPKSPECSDFDLTSPASSREALSCSSLSDSPDRMSDPYSHPGLQQIHNRSLFHGNPTAPASDCGQGPPNIIQQVDCQGNGPHWTRDRSDDAAVFTSTSSCHCCLSAECMQALCQVSPLCASDGMRTCTNCAWSPSCCCGPCSCTSSVICCSADSCPARPCQTDLGSYSSHPQQLSSCSASSWQRQRHHHLHQQFGSQAREKNLDTCHVSSTLLTTPESSSFSAQSQRLRQQQAVQPHWQKSLAQSGDTVSNTANSLSRTYNTTTTAVPQTSVHDHSHSSNMGARHHGAPSCFIRDKDNSAMSDDLMELLDTLNDKSCAPHDKVGVGLNGVHSSALARVLTSSVNGIVKPSAFDVVFPLDTAAHTETRRRQSDSLLDSSTSNYRGKRQKLDLINSPQVVRSSAFYPQVQQKAARERAVNGLGPPSRQRPLSAASVSSLPLLCGLTSWACEGSNSSGLQSRPAGGHSHPLHRSLTLLPTSDLAACSQSDLITEQLSAQRWCHKIRAGQERNGLVQSDFPLVVKQEVNSDIYPLNDSARSYTSPMMGQHTLAPASVMSRASQLRQVPANFCSTLVNRYGLMNKVRARVIGSVPETLSYFLTATDEELSDLNSFSPSVNCVLNPPVLISQDQHMDTDTFPRSSDSNPLRSGRNCASSAPSICADSSTTGPKSSDIINQGMQSSAPPTVNEDPGAACANGDLSFVGPATAAGLTVAPGSVTADLHTLHEIGRYFLSIPNACDKNGCHWPGEEKDSVSGRRNALDCEGEEDGKTGDWGDTCLSPACTSCHQPPTSESAGREPCLRRHHRYWHRHSPSPFAVHLTAHNQRLLTAVATAFCTLRDRLAQLHRGDWPAAQPGEGGWSSQQLLDTVHQQGRIIAALTKQFLQQIPGGERLAPEDVAMLSQQYGFGAALIVLASLAFDNTSRRFLELWSWTAAPSSPLFCFKVKLLAVGFKIHQISMDKMETALLCALSLVSTDISNLTNKEVICQLRSSLLDGLEAYISSRDQWFRKRVKRLFSVMPDVRLQSVWHFAIISHMQHQIYNHHHHRPQQEQMLVSHLQPQEANMLQQQPPAQQSQQLQT